MIKLNFDKVFKAKGIDKPFSFLVNKGFSDNYATKVNNNKVKMIGMEQLERLCIVLRCTPNDLFDWSPDSKFNVDMDHPLHTISKPDKAVDMRRTLDSIPLGKIYEIEQMINEQVKPK